MEWQINKALSVRVHENNVREHFYCVKEIFDLYNTKEKLEKLAARPDLDTVCAFDYYRMKTFALGTSTTQGKSSSRSANGWARGSGVGGSPRTGGNFVCS